MRWLSRGSTLKRVSILRNEVKDFLHNWKNENATFFQMICSLFTLCSWLTFLKNWISWIFRCKVEANGCLNRKLPFMLLLTLLKTPGFGNFCKKNSSFRLPYQRPSSSADCARELFSGSNESASLVDYTWKKIFCLGVQFFCEWRHKWRSFSPPWPTSPGPECQPLGGSISLKFLLETTVGYNPSLLILWMTCWGFRFKSCDLK